jgi:hypothetical protein
VLNLNTQPFKAPSWSWAAVSTDEATAYIRFRQHMEIVKMAEAKDVVCQPCGADPTGKLENAYLTLSTKAIPARLIHLDYNEAFLTTPYTLCFDFPSANLKEVVGLKIREWDNNEK